MDGYGTKVGNQIVSAMLQLYAILCSLNFILNGASNFNIWVHIWNIYIILLLVLFSYKVLEKIVFLKENNSKK